LNQPISDIDILNVYGSWPELADVTVIGHGKGLGLRLVCPLVCQHSLLLWARPAGDIDRLLHDPQRRRRRVTSNKCIAVRKVATPLRELMPHGITQCYLPPGRGDIPALTPAEAGTRLSDPGGMQG